MSQNEAELHCSTMTLNEVGDRQDAVWAVNSMVMQNVRPACGPSPADSRRGTPTPPLGMPTSALGKSVADHEEANF